MKRFPHHGRRISALVTGLAVAAAGTVLGTPVASPHPDSPASGAGSHHAPSPSDTASVSSLAAAFLAEPADPARAHAFRLAARRAGHLDSAMAVLEAALARDPKAHAARLELGLAHVDQLANRDLEVKQRFLLGGRAISLFSEVLNANPADWAARYARGMTHVLFPRASRHSDPAVEDFERLLAQQKSTEWRPYHVLSHVGLGDAYVINKQKGLARSTWEEGAKLFGDNPELLERLAIEPAAMDSVVASLRSLERPFDTDLSFLWAP
jgi:tetratricopeptide (TPR) repeat protein